MINMDVVQMVIKSKIRIILPENFNINTKITDSQYAKALKVISIYNHRKFEGMD